ncbi:MAG: hypothetical protein P8010_14085 [Desulfosarcinaceae bacterium]
MRPFLRRTRHLASILTFLLLNGCSLPLANHSRFEGSAARQGLIPMSAEKRYAGEVLAYMMRVVLGQAGDLKRRDEWRHRGLGQPLDLGWIEAVMDHPERSKKDLIVMDAGLIGLSEVLYDYNPRLNLFKGRYTFHSPYPSAELIALRLLLLGKLERGETLTLGAIVRNEAALVAEGGALPVVKLTEMGLNADEADLLSDVFRREPIFRWYYKSPPLVAAMDAMGLLTPERFVERLSQAHDYAVWHRVDAPTAPPTNSENPVVRVAVLPSLIPGYRADRRNRLAPPEDVVDTFVKLKATLEKAVAVKRGRTAAPESLEIQLYLGRPFVLHPQNAVHQLSRLCPDADLAVIVLGRNVYRAMDLSAAVPSAPLLHHWYLDILDLKYDQATAEIDAIAAAVVDRF